MKHSPSISGNLGGLLTAGVIWLSAGALWAQTALPPTDNIDKERKKSQVVLNQDVRELGQEYLEILQDLKELTADYAQYLAAIKSEQVARQEQELKQFDLRLTRGQYLRNMQELSIDLKKLQEVLRLQADSLRAGNGKAYSVTYNLSRDLGAARATLLAATANRQTAEKELAQQFAKVVEKSEHGVTIDTDKLRKLCVMLQCQDSLMNWSRFVPDFSTDSGYFAWNDSGFPGTIWVNVDSIEKLYGDHEHVVMPVPEVHMVNTPDVPEVPPVPEMPELPAITGPRDIVYKGQSGATRVVKEFADSIAVRSGRTTIVIGSPMGDVSIRGWDRPMVSVSSEVRISADQPRKANELAQKVGIVLRMSGNKDSVYVDCTLPNLHDPAVNIDNDLLEVRVPWANAVIASSSFGNVDVADMRNDVTLGTNHSDVSADAVLGNLTISSASGDISVTNCSGNLVVTNSHGDISVEASRGSMAITNRFASITLDNCVGDVVIDNSGPIDIAGHVGDAKVTNRNGAVEILQSKGDYVVNNSMQAVNVENIDGSVELGNVRAPITVSDISGGMKADNKFGSIDASYISGPLDLSSKGGSIVLVLNKDLDGPSTIQSDFGVIRLTLSPDTDVLVKARTDGGDIQSTWPLSIATAGTVKSTELSLGGGKNKLTLSGDRATIILSESK